MLRCVLNTVFVFQGVVAAIVIYNFWTVILGIAFTETSDEVGYIVCN